jgi:hypothetical protein
MDVLLRRVAVIVARKYVFNRLSAEKLLSAVEVLAGNASSNLSIFMANLGQSAQKDDSVP